MRNDENFYGIISVRLLITSKTQIEAQVFSQLQKL